VTEKVRNTMTTAEVAQLLGLTTVQVLYRAHRDAIQVPKHGDRYFWTVEAVEELRAADRRHQALQSQASAQGLTSHEAAGQLGLSYPRLISLIRDQELPIPRVGPLRRLVFDDAALELVREALRRPKEIRLPPAGFTTKQVATALGVSYEILVTVMTPLRKTLPLQKEGSNLVWSAEAVRIVREALERRHTLQWTTEVADYEQALRSIETVTAALQKLTAHVRKIQGLLARKPAETAFIQTLPARTHVLTRPLGILLIPIAGTGFQASLAELSLVTEGRTRREALRLMRQRLWARYREVSAAPDSAPDEWTALQQLITRRDGRSHRRSAPRRAA